MEPAFAAPAPYNTPYVRVFVTFLASEISHMVQQTEGDIIWFNNEEQGNKVAIRCYSAVLGLTTDDLFRDIEYNQRKFEALTQKRIRIYDFEDSSRASRIDAILKTTNPALIIFDQIDKIIVLDDCDSVFKDDDAVNILKGALDSYDTRKISYISTKSLKDEYGCEVPRHFEFSGRIIFISNISQSKLDEAIRSRSFVADVDLTTEQMFERIEQLIPKMESRVPQAAKEQALQLMKELDAEFEIEINLRSFIKAARICAMGFENPKMMVAEQICTL